MKWLIALLFTVGIIGSAQADTAWYYDNTRSGEGIIATTTDDGKIAFAFFTQVGNAIPGPPTVSPPPPTPTITTCTNSTIWFTGIGVYVDGAAIGKLRYDLPIPSFPVAVRNRVSISNDVGTFLIEKTATGYQMMFESNYTLPNIEIFNTVYNFQTLLVK